MLIRKGVLNDKGYEVVGRAAFGLRDPVYSHLMRLLLVPNGNIYPWTALEGAQSQHRQSLRDPAARAPILQKGLGRWLPA